MRVLYAVSEVFPLVKTGGLADVAAGFPAALAEHDVDVCVVLPGYRRAIERAVNSRQLARFTDWHGYGELRILATTLSESAVPVWLVDCPALFDRDGTPYQDQDGHDWPDNAERFGQFCQITAQLALGKLVPHWRADLVHANDWHTGLLPLLLSAGLPPCPATVLTIHNLAYQGIFPAEASRSLGLPNDPQLHSVLEFYGQLSLLKAGICSAGALTTVSPTYAKEILTPEYGCGLDGLLRHRAASLTGIMNGADYDTWDPARDRDISHPFSSRHLAPKRACKTAIQEEMGLDVSSDAPLIAFSSRLAHQKMPDVVLQGLPTLLAEGIQFALVAEGDPAYEIQFREIAGRYPGRAAVRVDYNDPLARRLLAGADILMHPSRFEPCGLAPIYAMRYGTIPVVRRSGGTCDSVIDAIEQTVHCEQATGFAFNDPTADELVACVRRALEVYRQPVLWRKIQICAMRRDFSWKRPAQAYVDLYRRLIGPLTATKETGEAIDDLKPIA
jgi:starch synthase